MVGSGETYIPAFALALGLGEVFAGLIASVPMAIGGWLQLLTSGYAARVRDQQRWIVVWAGLQGCVFFGLALLAIIEVRSWWPVLVCASLYWTCGLAAGPCWNTWIGGLVAPRLRPKFFAFRTLLCQFCTLFGLVAGGWLLSLGNGIAAAFALTFTFAGLWRLISVWFLGRHQMPERIFRDPERTLALDRAGAARRDDN